MGCSDCKGTGFRAKWLGKLPPTEGWWKLGSQKNCGLISCFEVINWSFRLFWSNSLFKILDKGTFIFSSAIQLIPIPSCKWYPVQTNSLRSLNSILSIHTISRKLPMLFTYRWVLQINVKAVNCAKLCQYLDRLFTYYPNNKVNLRSAYMLLNKKRDPEERKAAVTNNHQFIIVKILFAIAIFPSLPILYEFCEQFSWRAIQDYEEG